VTIEAEVKTTGQTGVEMEALTAVSVAALTVYDMLKAVDRAMVIEAIRLALKEGGKSGRYEAPDAERRGGACAPDGALCAPRPPSACRWPRPAVGCLPRTRWRRATSRPLPPRPWTATPSATPRRVPGARLAVIGTAAAGARFDGRGRRGRGGAHLHRRPGARGRRCASDPGGRRARGGTSSRSATAPAGRPTCAPPAATSRRAPRSSGAAAAAPGRRRAARRDERRRGRVTRRPVVALVPTGDELVWPGETPGPDQIVSSNNFGLKAMLEAAGAEVAAAADRARPGGSLGSAFDLAEGADLVVTLGGASVGDHDLVRAPRRPRPRARLLQGRDAAGQTADGRPARGTALVGLPGNPVSAWSAATSSCGRRCGDARARGLPPTQPATLT
jgi:hypothetical protein